MANRVSPLLVTAVAAACSLSAYASEPTQADYAKVVLYADVTIAQDSSSVWGLWEELEAPAAGPVVSLPELAARLEPYRPVGVPETGASTGPQTLPGACASGGLCGFGVIYAYNPSTPPGRNQSFQLLPGDAPASSSGSWLPPSLELSTQSVIDTSGFTGFAPIGPMTHDGNQTHALAGSATNSLTTNLGTAAAATGTSGSTLDHFNGKLANYINNSSGIVYGVWGVTSTAQDMNALRGSGVTATYNGAVLNKTGANNGTVSMQVNFGAGSFTANFSNVGGGQLATGQTVGNKLAFDVTAGTINGSTFSATQLSPNVTGKVEGAFFGANAAMAGGVIDVTSKTPVVAGSTPGLPRYVAPFVAAKN